MDALISFFTGIGDVIVSGFNFILSFVEDLVWIVQTLFWAIAQANLMLLWLPTKIMALVAVLLSVVMLYKIMGREG